MLHQRNTVRESLDDDVFASNDLSVAMPKYRMPDHEHDPAHVLQVVVGRADARRQLAPEPRDVLPDLGSSRRSARSWTFTLDKNMIDKDEYPQTAELEERCVHMLADLWNSPEAREHARDLDDRLERGRDARRHGAPVEVARTSAALRASRPTGRTSSPAPSRSAGTSSRATGTSSTARSRWRATG